MKKFIFFFILLFSFSLLVPRLVFASNVLLADDFEDGMYDGWSVKSGTWNIENISGSKRLGSTVNSNQTVVEITAGDISWEDYVFEMDMIALQGADKNIIFRVKDNNNKYGIHMRSNDGGVSELVCIERWSSKGGDVLSFWDKCRDWNFINNKLYHLKVTALNNNIKFYVDDVLAIDFTDEIAPIYNGKIGLRVGTGAVAPTEIYFDNVKVTKIRDPIVVIPGHGASINFQEMFLGQDDPNGWQMVPGAHVYDNLINTLEYNGYEEGKNLFVFYYNWLDSIDSSAKKLHDFINDIAKNSPTGKVNIIGHSMGGLVARGCLEEKYGENCLVDKMVTVGSPHLGVPEAYGAWEGGEIWKKGFVNRVALEIFLNIKRQLGETRKETVREIAPSTKDFLPIFSYLKINDGQVIQFSPDDYPQNNLLANWAPFSSFPKMTPYIIYGENQPTLRWLTITKNLSWIDRVLGNWEYGKPVEMEYVNDGDGTVSVLSAYPEASLSAFGFELGHREIVSEDEAISKIMGELDLESTSGADFQEDAQDYLAFYLHSPAHLEVANLPKDDVFLGEDDGKLKLIIIANPQVDKEYSVNVVGDEKGEYTLTVGQISDEQSNWDDYRGLTNPGEKDTFLIRFNPDTNQERLKDVQVLAGELPLNELIESLRVEMDQNSLLVQKLDNLKNLIPINLEKSWEYIYQIRNLTASLYKSGRINSDIQKVNSQLDSIAVYLKALAQNKPRVLAGKEAELNFRDAQEIVDNLAVVSYSDIEHLGEEFSLPAAFDFSLAQKSLKESSGDSYPAYLSARQGYFLGRNSKVLIQ